MRKKSDFKKDFNRAYTLSRKNGWLEEICSHMIELKKPKTQRAVLSYFQDKILPVQFENIALFYTENRATFLVTFEEKKHHICESMEELEENISDDFFRINRNLEIGKFLLICFVYFIFLFLSHFIWNNI